MAKKVVRTEVLFDLDEAENRLMECLDKQTEELAIYSSTPHTTETQQRVYNTLNLLARIKEMQKNGNST